MKLNAADYNASPPRLICLATSVLSRVVAECHWDLHVIIPGG
jgi:hypothetical protein